MARRRVRLHVGGDDPWIDIRRSGSAPQRDSDDDWIVTVVGVVLLVLLVAWLIS